MIETPQNDPVVAFAEELISDCPFDHGNPEHCPLCDLRARPHEERLEFIRSIPREMLESLVVYHWFCLESKVLDELRAS